MPELSKLSAELDAKRDRLLSILLSFDRVAVAFSGGIDSTVVAKAAFLALGQARRGGDGRQRQCALS